MKHIENNYIALGISAILLLVALINGLPYGYFTFMRIVVCLSTAYMAWALYEDNDTVWVWIFAAIAILFNPIAPINLGREVWVWVDGAVGVFLLAVVYLKGGQEIPFLWDFFDLFKIDSSEDDVSNVISKIKEEEASGQFLFTGMFSAYYYYFYESFLSVYPDIKKVIEREILPPEEVTKLLKKITPLAKQRINSTILPGSNDGGNLLLWTLKGMTDRVFLKKIYVLWLLIEKHKDKTIQVLNQYKGELTDSLNSKWIEDAISKAGKLPARYSSIYIDHVLNDELLRKQDKFENDLVYNKTGKRLDRLYLYKYKNIIYFWFRMITKHSIKNEKKLFYILEFWSRYLDLLREFNNLTRGHIGTDLNPNSNYNKEWSRLYKDIKDLEYIFAREMGTPATNQLEEINNLDIWKISTVGNIAPKGYEYDVFDKLKKI